MKKRIKILTITTAAVMLLLPTILFTLDRKAVAPHQTITLPTSHMSFFQLNRQGELDLKDGLPYHGKLEHYASQVRISPEDTAFFVIDPWNDMPSDFLNKFYGKITDKYILPLVTQVSKKKFPVIIFTNDCKTIKPKPYSCAIAAEFYALTKQYPNIQIMYWQNLNADDFAKHLQQQGISKIIYVGYASNMCVIGRPLGMITMKQKGFSLYFIPQASAAVETEQTWQSQQIHQRTTEMISQWLAEIINFDDISGMMKG